MTRRKKQSAKVRCAVYTRVSTSEQADREYSSLEAQRETGEAYIVSQKHAGWECLPDRYDDGGFTGANVDRPAFQQLMQGVASGRVDCIVCYKLDRLTRSLVGFARILETLDRHKVAIVSVTQAFDTSTATGKLMMHILMSFAEFERQLISERTRDKIASARRRGKWSGGMPVLGYDVFETKLVIDDDEADQVRQIFDLYLKARSLTAVAGELDRRGWVNKAWTTKKGLPRGGSLFSKSSLHKLLTNSVYIGKVRHKGDEYDGEHAGIVDEKVFRRVQKQLRDNGSDGGRKVRNKYGALLKGLVRCKHCGCIMTHHYTQKGNRRYRYYVCTNAQKRGWKLCPKPSLPAGRLEAFVVDQIRGIGRDPTLVRETTEATAEEIDTQTRQLKAEAKRLRRSIADKERQLSQLAVAELDEEVKTSRLAELQSQVADDRRRLGEVESELTRLDELQCQPDDVAALLRDFDAVWRALKPVERTRVIELLVDRVVWDGEAGSISVVFHDTGLTGLGETMEETNGQACCHEEG